MSELRDAKPKSASGGVGLGTIILGGLCVYMLIVGMAAMFGGA